jgi:putative glutathione S-transferase
MSTAGTATPGPGLIVRDDTEDQSNAAARKLNGEFVRGVSAARNFVSTDPSAEFPVETGRYHLYVAYNCPWCHRVALGRALLGLEDVITMDVLFPVRTEADHPEGEGRWQFRPEGLTARNGEALTYPGYVTEDTVTGKGTVVEIYRAAGLEGEKSVPLLFDKKTLRVVNNESSEILRMMSLVFAAGKSGSGSTTATSTLYPDSLRVTIEELNESIYQKINNGAYKAGFSSNQQVYQEAYARYFSELDRLDELLARSRFLTGDSVTEADVRLFPTVFRHDPQLLPPQEAEQEAHRGRLPAPVDTCGAGCASSTRCRGWSSSARSTR